MKLKKKFFINTIIFASLISSFSTLFLIEKVFKDEYAFLKYKYSKLKSNIFQKENTSINQSCKPIKINKIPKDSTIIIGHAYGSHKMQDSRGENASLAPKISSFLELNKKLISTIIFFRRCN